MESLEKNSVAYFFSRLSIFFQAPRPFSRFVLLISFPVFPFFFQSPWGVPPSTYNTYHQWRGEGGIFFQILDFSSFWHFFLLTFRFLDPRGVLATPRAPPGTYNGGPPPPPTTPTTRRRGECFQVLDV